MITNIIFDVGKVLVSYEPDAYMEQLGYDRTVRNAINQAMFRNPLWEKADQGIYTSDEFLQRFIANAPDYERQIRELYRTIGNTIALFPYTMDWLKSLKERGYHLYILSNYSENMYEQTKQKMQFLSLVDGAVFSYTCKRVKPDAAIYEHLMKQFRLNASESVFLDDRPENTEAARRCGIHAIEFTDYEHARAALDELLRG